MILIKKILAVANATWLTGRPKLSMQFSRGAAIWQPVRHLNFKIKGRKIVSRIDESSFGIKHLEKFHYSLKNLNKALEQYKFQERDNEVYFSPKKAPQLQFVFQRYDNINAANEIFYEGLYNIHTNASLIVFDVGANVGIASVFFSTLPSVKKIVAFEPFKGSYSFAVRNVHLNQIGNVELLNIGLSNSDKEIEVPDVEEGFMGASTTEFFIEEQKKLFDLPEKHTTITLKKASTFLDGQMKAAPHHNYLLKLDCEGAEYEIIEDLLHAGMLSRFRFIIVEWHFKGPDSIIRQLKDTGFSVLEFSREVGSPMGMIYAFNNGIS